MFRNVVAFVMIREVPIACEGLAKDWIEWFLNASIEVLGYILAQVLFNMYLRWLDMPSAEVEFHHGHKSLQRIVNIRH